MKKSIIVKYAREEDKEYQINIVDGDRNKSHRVGDTLTGEENQEPDAPNQALASLEGIVGYPLPQAERGLLQI